MNAFKEGESLLPGAMVVKEKYPYMRDHPPIAYAAMIKQEPGFDPENGDWEYVYAVLWPDDERRVTRGKLDYCINCHRGAKDTDYLFRSYLKTNQK